MRSLCIGALLGTLSRIVPSPLRARWLEEWRAEVAHGRWTMVFGALPDAWAMRKLPASLTRAQSREGGRTASWHGPWQTDARQTIRSLARSPWHIVTVSLCLGIGIAVSVTTFSILSSILTGNLPGIEDRATLMRVYLSTDQWWGRSSPENASLSDHEILREGSPSLPAVAAEGRSQFAVRTPAGAAAVQGAFVSGNYFQVLGTRPALGRLFTPDDDRPGAAPSVVLSHAFWTAQLGAPADVVGSTIVVGGHDMQVVGVAPEYFSGTDVGDLGEPPGLRYRLYLPLSLSSTLASVRGRDDRWLTVIGRATADHPREVFAAELQPLAARIEGLRPAIRKNASVLVLQSTMGPSDTPGVVALIVMLLMSAPITVLLIGCANVANLQLVRASLRSRELAVRLAIGASRKQLVRLLAVESVFLAITACAAGAVGTYLLLRIAALVIPFRVGIDWPVLVFIVAVAALVVLATGIIPAWFVTRSRDALSLRAGRSPGAGTPRIRRGLVVAQIALSLLLLLTASLFTRSLGVLVGRVPPSAREVVVADVRFDTLGYSQPQRAAFIESLQDRLQADGRVEAVGVNTIAPLRQSGMRFWLPTDAADRIRTTDGGEVTPDWFNAADIGLLRGRTFTAEDGRLGTAAIVDQAFIQKYRLQEPVLGTVLRVERPGTGISEPAPLNPGSVQPGESVVFFHAPLRPNASGPVDVTIVGVMANRLPRPVTRETPASLYLPLDHVPDYVAIYVRSSRPSEIRQQVRETMAAIDRNLPAVEISSVADRFIEDAGDIRLLAQAATGLGTAALLLAIAGVYSVVAFFVSLRTHEFGIRLAIGARPRDITSMVTLQASKLVGAGVIVGFVLAIPVLLLLGRAFPYTSAFDPAGLLGPVAALALTAVAAAAVPARKAARVDPCTALRSE